VGLPTVWTLRNQERTNSKLGPGEIHYRGPHPAVPIATATINNVWRFLGPLQLLHRPAHRPHNRRPCAGALLRPPGIDETDKARLQRLRQFRWRTSLPIRDRVHRVRGQAASPRSSVRSPHKRVGRCGGLPRRERPGHMRRALTTSCGKPGENCGAPTPTSVDLGASG